MSFGESLKAAMARHLEVSPGDIVDVGVRWDSGDRYDPTYPSENEAPIFEVTVSLRNGDTRNVSTEWMFTELLRAVLREG